MGKSKYAIWPMEYYSALKKEEKSASCYNMDAPQG
jgi:hypothetical protein